MNRPKHYRHGVTIAVVLLFLTSPVLAHDYWFKPEVFFAAVGATIPVHLYVGDEYKIEEEARPRAGFPQNRLD